MMGGAILEFINYNHLMFTAPCLRGTADIEHSDELLYAVCRWHYGQWAICPDHDVSERGIGYGSCD